MSGPHLYIVDLGVDELAAVLDLASNLVDRYGSVENQKFQDCMETYAQDLPRRLRTQLNHFRLHEPACVCLIRGIPVADYALGPTPAHWRDASAKTVVFDMLFCLSGAILGSPFAWSTKQDGRLVHNIVPIANDRNAQLASSSDTALTWHTEDGFHPLRADFLGLMCLRNPGSVQTVFSCVHDIDPIVLTDPILFQPRFHIRPDGSQLSDDLARHPDIPEMLHRRARQRVRRMDSTPTPTPVLFGNPDCPYLRLDQFFASAVYGDLEAANSLDALINAVSDGSKTYPLAPGEICFIDNYKAVHGREAFQARHDGTDRWLRRINITRDLRRSRSLRTIPSSRLLA